MPLPFIDKSDAIDKEDGLNCLSHNFTRQFNRGNKLLRTEREKTALNSDKPSLWANARADEDYQVGNFKYVNSFRI